MGDTMAVHRPYGAVEARKYMSIYDEHLMAFLILLSVLEAVLSCGRKVRACIDACVHTVIISSSIVPHHRSL